jgi:hypothetical protein
LTLASTTDITSVNGIYQGIIPFQVSAQEASGKGDFPFGGFESLEPEFFSGRTNGSAERRRAIVISLLTSPAGGASPDRIFKIFKSGDIPFHVNLLIVNQNVKCQSSNSKRNSWNLTIRHGFDIWILTFGFSF